MRERVGESRITLWLLITANRWAIAGTITVGAFVLLLVFDAAGPTSIRKLTTGTTVSTVFGSIIIATVTSVTLVLTISQLVLSQEIGPLGEQRQRMQRATEFREDVEDTSNIGIAPADPSHFLQTLIDVVERRADTLNGAVTDGSDSNEFGDIVSYTDGVIEHSNEVRGDLEDAEFGSFQVLLPVLNYNYSWKIAAGRNLRNDYRESLSDAADDAFADLIEALRFFGPAREHFKTLYFQWEVVNISRAMLYSAMPALMLAGYMVFVVDPSGISGAIGGFSTAYLFVSAVYVISLFPFAVLLSYLLRLLTVAKRTLAIGPFVLRDSEHLEKIQSRNESE